MYNRLSFNHPALSEVSEREWLLSNGIGGYASSSICGMNTRRYHGLLVAALDPPTQRRVLVSRVEEQVIVGDDLYELGTNQYPGAIHPQGFKHVSEFIRDPFPCTSFRFGGLELRKSIAMVHGSNTTLVCYHNPASEDLSLVLRPHLTDRDYHSLSPDGVDYRMSSEKQLVVIHSRQSAPPLFMGWTHGEFETAPDWYHNLAYEWERRRGQDFSEDTFSPGAIRLTLKAGASACVCFTLEEELLSKDPFVLLQQEADRLEQLIPSGITHPFAKALIKSGDQFIVHRVSTNSASIIAGYPWFTDWGRDTMIAMRGLVIAMGKQQEAKAIMKTFLAYLSEGMLPNRFPDEGEMPEYNTVDATLWLFVAAYEYAKKFEDWEFIREIMPQLSQIIDAHLEGTRFDIHVDGKGFLYSGSHNTQLTWMDARVWGHVITPRWGCAVEVNALWYNALRIYSFFSEQLETPPGLAPGLHRKIRRHFRTYFLNSNGYLNDRILPGEWADDSFRPNQLYALSLPYPLLNKQEGKALLRQVEEKLLTDYGLRTLSGDQPEFKGRYSGNQWDRDNAYHQGTVWPFLLGTYFRALIYTEKGRPEILQEISRRIELINGHFFSENCIQGISEIFDGDEPKSGKGTIHQAWSVSEILSVMLSHNLMLTAQKNEKNLSGQLA